MMPRLQALPEYFALLVCAAQLPAAVAPARGPAVTPYPFPVGPLPPALAEFAPWFSRYVNVFGVHIIATPGHRFGDYTTPFTDATLAHAANVLAKWLDNDEDGLPADPRVVASLVRQNALLYMTPTGADGNDGAGTLYGTDRSVDAMMADFQRQRPRGFATQFLHGQETIRYAELPLPPGQV
jgi:hypothetical protein